MTLSSVLGHGKLIIAQFSRGVVSALQHSRGELGSEHTGYPRDDCMSRSLMSVIRKIRLLDKQRQDREVRSFEVLTSSREFRTPSLRISAGQTYDKSNQPHLAPEALGTHASSHFFTALRTVAPRLCVRALLRRGFGAWTRALIRSACWEEHCRRPGDHLDPSKYILSPCRWANGLEPTWQIIHSLD